MARDTRYYDKLTSMHVNTEMQVLTLKFAKENNTHFYVLVDNALRDFFKKHKIKVPEKNIIK